MVAGYRVGKVGLRLFENGDRLAQGFVPFLGPPCFPQIKAPLAVAVRELLRPFGLVAEFGGQLLENVKVAPMHFHGFGIGFQVYTWNGSSWSGAVPDATLFDEEGNIVATHFGVFDANGGFVGPAWRSNSGSETVGLVLLLSAFSNGCTALTGIEAISDGVPAFKPPESKHAAQTLVTLASGPLYVYFGAQRFWVMAALLGYVAAA